jgi:inner membrane protein
MGRRTAVWKAALWGGVCGTLPDLDVLIDYGDPISNMTLHRAHSHALFWLTLASPLIAAGVAWLHGEWMLVRRWWLAVWLALVTHPLLDAMTVYGTQLALPLTNHPFGVGSIFIIDPLFTLPLVVGVVAALAWRAAPVAARGLRWNAWGLALSTSYLAWGVLAQQWVAAHAAEDLARAGIRADRVLITPAPLQSLLWRVVVVEGDAFHEGFHSFFDGARPIRFDRFERGATLEAELAGDPRVETIAAFSKGFYKLAQRGSDVLLSDLRMGQEPNYVFAFVVAQKASAARPVDPPRAAGGRGDTAAGLRWLWARMWGADVAPPR